MTDIELRDLIEPLWTIAPETRPTNFNREWVLGWDSDDAGYEGFSWLKASTHVLALTYFTHQREEA